MKFVLLVEGYTEKNALPQFLKRWLDPQLRQPVGIRTVRFSGWQHYYDEIEKKVELNLSGKAGANVVAAVGLLDLYGPAFYPQHLVSAHDRYAWAKLELEKKVANPKFRQHFAVHEVEAWLLSEPTLFPQEIRRSLPGRAAEPETVNFDEPPARLLERLYWEKLRRSYRKITDGTNLFLELAPDSAYRKCPFLRQLFDDLFAIAKDAGLCR